MFHDVSRILLLLISLPNVVLSAYCPELINLCLPVSLLEEWDARGSVWWQSTQLIRGLLGLPECIGEDLLSDHLPIGVCKTVTQVPFF